MDKSFGFKDGLFSGYKKNEGDGPSMGGYDKSSWAFQMDDKGIPKVDKTLTDKHSVFQLLKTHYQRYDLDTVVKVTGTPRADLLKVYETYAKSGARGKAGTIMYAMGWTPAHSGNPDHHEPWL